MLSRRALLGGAAFLLPALMLPGRASGRKKPHPHATSTPTASPSASPTATPTPSPTATPTAQPTPTPAPSPTFRWGMFDEPYPLDRSGYDALALSLGRAADLEHWYAAWTPWGAWEGYHANGVRDTLARGRTPMITWEAWSGQFGRNGSNPFPLAAIAAGQFDVYVDEWARGLRSVGGTVYLRLFHEMNISYQPGGYPWSVYKGGNPFGNTPAALVAAWRHVVDRFRLAGATNVRWVFNPAGDLTWNPVVAGAYPGDGYVDYLGFDAYEGAPAGSVALDMPIIEGLGPQPLVLGEVGGHATWIRNELAPALARPRTHAAAWFNLGATRLDTDADRAAVREMLAGL